MSFLRTHRLHWGSLTAASNLHEHLDLLMQQSPGSATSPEADSTPTTSLDAPTELPSQIIHAPSTQRELGL